MNDRTVRRPGLVASVFLIAAMLALPPAAAARPGGTPSLPEGVVGQESQASSAQGSENGDGNGPDEAGEEDSDRYPGGKRMTATRVDRALVIDGLVNDEAWEEAEVVSDFLQREPDNAQPASERTEVRVLYDDEYLYFGFVMFDSQPERITATDLQRDSRLRDDDTIAVLLDTFHDHRNGFLFRTNPLGTKYDALLRNERDVNADWNEKWEAAAEITERGWEAEMAIPWKALRFPTGTHVWGIDFKREIRRRNEEDNWSNYQRGFQFNAISQGGHLVGLEGLKLTKRFRFKPYVSGGGAQFNVTADPRSDLSGDVGVEDFKVQITPNLTADFTANTDFAQVEDDNERVNLTRFSLFFPEKREFFLESANNFAFGTSRRHGGFGGPQVNLYHSRNIGLESGEAVPIVYGAKMTGKIGSTNVGLLNVQTDDSEFGSGENFTALRAKQDIFERSSIGAIFTNVQGGADHNRVVGFDGNFQLARFLSIRGFAARVDDNEIDGNPWAGQFSAGWNSDVWNLSGSYTVVEPEFRSDLGFITRTDMERQSYNAGFSPRPGVLGIRQVRLNTSFEYLTDTGGRLLTKDTGANTIISFQSGESIWVSYSRNFERLDFDFRVAGEGIVPAGDYSFDTWNFNFNTYGARKLSGRIRVTTGDWFNGTRTSINPGGQVRLSEKLSISPSWSFNRITLPTGRFDTQTISVRSAYNFNDRWLTNSLVQYNSVTDNVSVFARLNYIYRTGDDFFLVYKHSRRVAGDFSGEYDHSITAKLTRSFDF